MRTGGVGDTNREDRVDVGKLRVRQSRCWEEVRADWVTGRT